MSIQAAAAVLHRILFIQKFPKNISLEEGNHDAMAKLYVQQPHSILLTDIDVKKPCRQLSSQVHAELPVVIIEALYCLIASCEQCVHVRKPNIITLWLVDGSFVHRDPYDTIKKLMLTHAQGQGNDGDPHKNVSSLLILKKMLPQHLALIRLHLLDTVMLLSNPPQQLPCLNPKGQHKRAAYHYPYAAHVQTRQLQNVR
jgi:hypothetical protein